MDDSVAYCECSDTNCGLKCDWSVYDDFRSHYDTTKYFFILPDCPSRLRRLARRCEVPGVGEYYIYRHRITRDAVCECGQRCGNSWSWEEYTKFYEEGIETGEEFCIRHPDCQSAIDYSRILKEGENYIILER